MSQLLVATVYLYGKMYVVVYKYPKKLAFSETFQVSYRKKPLFIYEF